MKWVLIVGGVVAALGLFLLAAILIIAAGALFSLLLLMLFALGFCLAIAELAFAITLALSGPRSTRSPSRMTVVSAGMDASSSSSIAASRASNRSRRP